MPYERLHDGLVTVPVWGGAAICWLRLYRQPGASPQFVSVLTEGPELVKSVLRTSKGVVRKKRAEMH